MQLNELKNKRILITGINGFVGVHLAKKLESYGAVVFGISRSTIAENILRADILDYHTVDKFIKEKNIQMCCHLAGSSLVEAGQNDPYNTFQVNIQGALNILESSRKNALERVIISSTSHVYGDNDVPFYEQYNLKPSRPYETSKACIDLIARSYAESYHLPVFIPRFVNIYGPNDMNFSRLIPRTMQSVILGKSPTMWGGNVQRDYLYVSDAVDAYLLLLQTNISNADGSNVFNFGGGNKMTVEEIIKRIISISGKEMVIEKINETRNFEIKSQYVSYEKATSYLGWKPQVTIDEGLEKTYQWYKEYFAKNA